MHTKKVARPEQPPFLHEIVEWGPSVENAPELFLEMINAWIREILPEEELEAFNQQPSDGKIGKTDSSPLRRIVRFGEAHPYARLAVDLPLDGKPDHRFEVEFVQDNDGSAIRLRAHEHPDRRVTNQVRAKALRKQLIERLKAHEKPPELGIHLSDVVIRLETPELVDQFDEQVLRNPERSVPIILIAQTREGTAFDSFVDPEAILERVRGQTNVYYLANEASYRLTELVDKYQSCFHGGIRIYAPRTRGRLNPIRHPLLTRFRLDLLHQFEGAIEHVVTQTFEQVCQDRRESWHRQRRFNARSQLIQAAKEGGRTQRGRSRTRRGPLKPNWIPDFEREGWGDQITIQTQTEQVVEEKAETSSHIIELDSVGNAALLASVHFSDILAVLDCCLKSGTKYKRQAEPEEAYKLLSALADVGRQWRSQASIGGRFHEVLGLRMKEEYGLSAKASMTESGGTMQNSKFKQMRTFEGRIMEPHITLRRGDPNRCLHCYFELDKESGMINVGYLGEHLKGRKSANS